MCDSNSGLPLSVDEGVALLELDRGTPVTTEQAHGRLQDEIIHALISAENTLVTAPTGLGKTHQVATFPWGNASQFTGGQPVIHISQTRDARDDAIEMSEEAGVDYAVLRAREEVCPIAAGEYDNELNAPNGQDPSAWFDQKCDVEQIRFSEAHAYLERALGGLPCSQGERCESQTQWQDIPRNDDDEPEYDIIHATAPFANIPDLTENANIIFDEQPDYRLNFQQEHLRRAINDLLSRRADQGTHTWEELIEIGKQDTFTHWGGTLPPDNPETSARASEYAELLAEEVDEVFSDDFGSQTHTLAPGIGRAVLTAMEVGNDRYRGNDPNSQVSVVFNERNTLRVIHNPPNLSTARCVIGLDAHPTELLWEFNTDLDLNQEAILRTEEGRYWRRRERGLYVVQVGNNTNPLTRGWRNDRQRQEARAIIRGLRRKAGNEFRTAIVPHQLRDEIDSMLQEEGIEDSELLHYGGEQSLNTFEGEHVGLLLGCIDPGDDYVLDMLAAMGRYAEPEMEEDESGEMRRAYGRGFTGPNADDADELLRSVRETHVAQSIGRYARSPRESIPGAVVYVWTDAIPEDMIDFQVPGLTSQLTEENELTETKRAIDRFVREYEGAVTKRQVANEIDISDSYAYRVLETMREQDVVAVSEGTGENGANEYEYLSGSLGPTVDLDFQ